MPSTSQNKQIAKNTIVLYLRMVLTLGVGLYTVRMVLKILGVEDYGIYNVVGGTVSLLSFVVGFERVLLGKCSTVFDELGNVDTEKDNGNDDS